MPRLIRPPKKSKVVLASEDAVLYLERDDRISLRFIKKQLLSQSINILLKAANSRVRARFFFDQKMDVELVPSPKQIIDFPQDTETYQQLARSVLSFLREDLEGNEGVPPECIMEKPSRGITVHSECSLLLHLIKCTQNAKSRRYLAFVGCFKLSCPPCCFFFF